MERIECTDYEKKELIKILEYVKEKKLEIEIQNKKFNTTKYDIELINTLIKRIKGEKPYSYQLKK